MENEIEELLKNLKAKPNKRIRPSIDAQTYLNHVKTNTSLDPVEQLQKEIEKDFGIRVDDDGIVSNAEKWQFVEQKVNEQVLGQKEFVHQLILGFKRPYVLHHSLEKPLNHLLVIGKKGVVNMLLLIVLMK